MAMNLPGNKPLTEAEQEHLADFLAGKDAITLEELDGFFTALIVGPELVPPSEYLSVVFGVPKGETCEFDSMDEANEILGLLMRYQNAIAADFAKGPYHLPYLSEDDDGQSPANEWATGFMRGVEMRVIAWQPVIQDNHLGVWVFPMMMLAHEHDEDPEMRPPPISPETREDMIARMTAGAAKIYEYFRKQPGFGMPPRPEPVRRVKVGRNDPCPCGSGKKYKRCCGGVTVH